ncbi:MAG: hypothetical protein OEY43_04305 [Gammaproteobacteria bacterium]|nr:hypothetical protein [Gammaproteobacteria bacterium]
MIKDTGVKPEAGVIENSDAAESEAFLQEQLQQADAALTQLAADSDGAERGAILLKKANALLGLERREEAWDQAKQAFELYIAAELWPGAVEACDILYQADQPASIIALAHGVWLSVTYPIDPEHSIVMLSYVVDETPKDSDGAAVAAATAHYLVGLRADDAQHDSLSFLTTNLIAKVAQRHSDVKSQEALDYWMEKLDLNDPAIFLPRMSKVVNTIIGDNWWFDREALQSKLPLN